MENRRNAADWTRLILAVALTLSAFAAGLYFGLWWAFIGGIVAILESMKSTPVDSLGVALGVARVMFAGIIGWCAAAIMIIPANMLANKIK